MTVDQVVTPVRSGRWTIPAILILLGCLSSTPSLAADNIIDMQPYRAEVKSTEGGAMFRLINLQPNVGIWYVLERRTAAGVETAHLEVVRPRDTKLDLQGSKLIATVASATTQCPIATGNDEPLFAAGDQPFSPVCGAGVFLRRRHAGKRSITEAATDLLRSTSGGEAVINFYKNNLMDTAESAPLSSRSDPLPPPRPGAPATDVPTPADLTATYHRQAMPLLNQFGIPIAPHGRPVIGSWVAAEGIPGVFMSTITGDAAWPGAPGSVDAQNMIYLMAIDLTNTAVRFHVGTLHPGLAWSSRPKVMHDTSLGPDGIDSAEPLVRLGMVPPWQKDNLLAVFAGGFKREHGAFKGGVWSQREGGTHYGFVENGVVLSTLQPDLITFYGLTDGTIGMKTWTKEDDAKLGSHIVFARQNGLSVLEHGVAGPDVDNPNGNWSGSNEGHLLTLRAGICLARGADRTFLIYGIFTSGVPATMARVFSAYGCDAAMHLDMNALLLTYAAVYRHEGGQMTAFTLHKGMDQHGMRFVDSPDSRDFFSITRLGNKPSTAALASPPEPAPFH